MKILVIEPMCITVSGVTATPVAAFTTPAAAVSSIPFWKTAALAPGTWYLASAASRRACSSPAAAGPVIRLTGSRTGIGGAVRGTVPATPAMLNVFSSSRRFMFLLTAGSASMDLERGVDDLSKPHHTFVADHVDGRPELGGELLE